MIPDVMMWVTDGWMDGQIDRSDQSQSKYSLRLVLYVVCVLLRQFNSPEGMSRLVYYHHYHLIGGRGLASWSLA